MRSLTTALVAELGLRVTRPGYLVQLSYVTPVFLSTIGTVSWNGNVWSASDVRVSGIGRVGTGVGDRAGVSMGNTDNAFSALVLNQGASDVPVRVFAVYAGATATGDVVQEFGGVASGAGIDVEQNRVTLNLVTRGSGTLESPRVFINKVGGFTVLQPVGSKITVGQETIILGRG
jgi:hypothetical protein